jgi:hypothetical protein
VAKAASSEIQETREGSAAAQLPEPEEGDARILNLAHFSWATAFEAGADVEEDEESAGCHTLERGLSWACRAFDELILPATTVSFLDVATCLVFFCSSNICS